MELFNDDDEAISILTGILADDYELKNDKKAINDLISNYKKERLINRKKEIRGEYINALLSMEEYQQISENIDQKRDTI